MIKFAAETRHVQERTHGGFHRTLAEDHPYVFIDSCMQMWPDADFASAHLHGVTAYAVTAWEPHSSFDAVLEEMMFWHLVARRHPNLLIACTAEDIRQAKRDRRAALILAAQDGDWIGTRLHRLEAFHRLGLRMMLLAYNRTNQICDGTLDRTDGGLTRFGRLVVSELNRLGILIDCTHVGKRSTLDIINQSSDPCVFSHSNPSQLVANPRNIDDEQIRACIGRGGVIGLVSWGPLVKRPGASEWPTLDAFIDLVDYVVQMSGNTNHVGIGTDMSLGTYPDHRHDPWGEPDYPEVSGEYGRLITADIRSPRRSLDGFSDYADIVHVAERLVARGYRDEEVHAILGGNYLRIFGQVWRS